jgi:hypothetical protein
VALEGNAWRKVSAQEESQTEEPEQDLAELWRRRTAALKFFC